MFSRMAHDSCPKEDPDMTNPTPAIPVAGATPSTTTPAHIAKPEAAAVKIDPAAVKAEPVIAAKV